MTGPGPFLPPWPVLTKDVVQAVRAELAAGAERNPGVIAEFRRSLRIASGGGLSVTDDDILDLLATFAVTAPACVAAVPEFANVPRWRIAVETIRQLSGRSHHHGGLQAGWTDEAGA